VCPSPVLPGSSLSLVRFPGIDHFIYDLISCYLLLLSFSLTHAAPRSGWCGRRMSQRQGEETTRTLLAPSGRSRGIWFTLSSRRAERSAIWTELLMQHLQRQQQQSRQSVEDSCRSPLIKLPTKFVASYLGLAPLLPPYPPP
jgi:hypothetical protein